MPFPVMGGSNGHDATGLAMAHERIDALTRGRQIASNRNVMFRTRAPFARHGSVANFAAGGLPV
jgi:hypothetical protein